LRVAYCEAPAFEAEARKLLERVGVDVVHVDRERLARVFRFHRGPKVLDATDSISLYQRRLLKFGRGTQRAVALIEAPKMRGFERDMVSGYDVCLVAAHEDRVAMLPGVSDVPIRVVPNGVDQRFLAADHAEDPTGPRLVFVGNMFYPPNIDGACWFARRILPQLRQRWPDLELSLVGSRPGRAVQELESLPGVSVTGQVGDVLPFLQAATVFVSPIRVGGGFPNKLAEALAAGTPAVATPAGSDGIAGIVAGTHYLRGTTEGDFAKQVASLLSDPALRNRLGRAGKAFLRSSYSWSHATEALEAEYEEATVSGRGRVRPVARSAVDHA
jgi:glycosyltransferase involved in cell wall biosynthesis